MEKMMSEEEYEKILAYIKKLKMPICVDPLEKKFPTVCKYTLGSILANHVQKTMKMNHARHNKKHKHQEYYRKYKAGVERGEEGVILKISKQIGITPVLVAKFILEAFVLENHEWKLKEREIEQQLGMAKLKLDDEEGASSSSERDKLVKPKGKNTAQRSLPLRPYLTRNDIKAEVNKYLKNTASIPDRKLAFEVFLCTTQDEHYGPLPDSIKRVVGKQYEVKLFKMLKERGVKFIDENEMRRLGYDKTPDVKLVTPCAIYGGRVITWIESKATFADEETHKNYIRDQLFSYQNRFGPGLVIYWLGYVDVTLETRKGVYVCDSLPPDFKVYNPEKVNKRFKVFV